MSDLLNRALYCERKRLMKALDCFTKAMKARLLEMMFKGYRGWDNPARYDDFKTMLNGLMLHDRKNGYLPREVDVANLAMIIWNLNEKQKNPSKRRSGKCQANSPS